MLLQYRGFVFRSGVSTRRTPIHAFVIRAADVRISANRFGRVRVLSSLTFSTINNEAAVAAGHGCVALLAVLRLSRLARREISLSRPRSCWSTSGSFVDVPSIPPERALLPASSAGVVGLEAAPDKKGVLPLFSCGCVGNEDAGVAASRSSSPCRSARDCSLQEWRR